MRLKTTWINSGVEERINAVVKAGGNGIAQKYNHANTASATYLEVQVDDLESTFAQRSSHTSTLSSNIDTKGKGNQNPNTRDQQNRRQPNTPKEWGTAVDKVTWATELLFDTTWSAQKKRNYKSKHKRNEHPVTVIANIKSGATQRGQSNRAQTHILIF